MRPSWTKIALILAAFWLVVGTAIWFVQRDKPTPARIVAFLQKNPIEGKPEVERAKIVDEVGARRNRLTYEERLELSEGKQLEGFINAMNRAEKIRFYELVRSKTIAPFLEAWDKMDPTKRRRQLERTTRHLRENFEGSSSEEIDSIVRTIGDQSLKTLEDRIPVEMKLKALPFLEALERQVRWNP